MSTPSENLRRIWDEKKRELGLTLKIAAESLGIPHPTTLHRLLNGQSTLHMEHVTRFAGLLQVDPTEIDPDYGKAVLPRVQRPKTGPVTALKPNELGALFLYRGLDEQQQQLINRLMEQMQ